MLGVVIAFLLEDAFDGYFYVLDCGLLVELYVYG